MITFDKQLLFKAIKSTAVLAMDFTMDLGCLTIKAIDNAYKSEWLVKA